MIKARDIEKLLEDGREELRLDGVDIDNDALAAVRGVKSLSVERSPTLSSLKALDCPELTHLSLAGSSRLTARGLARLAELVSLEELDLSGGLATDLLLKKLALPRLRVLDISRGEGSSPITGAGLKKLDAPELEVLLLRGGNDGPGVWQGLARFPKLRELDLTGGHIGERRGLKKLDALEVLVARDLLHLALTRAFFGEVEGMPRLRRLDLRGSRFEAKPLTALLAARPELAVLHESLGTQLEPVPEPDDAPSDATPTPGRRRAIPEIDELLRSVEHPDGSSTRTIVGTEVDEERRARAAAEVDPEWLADLLASELEPERAVAALIVAAGVIRARGLEPPLDEAAFARIADGRTATVRIGGARPSWFLGGLALDAVLDAGQEVGRLAELLSAALENRDRPHLVRRVLRAADPPSSDLAAIVVEAALDRARPAELRWNAVVALAEEGKETDAYAAARTKALDGLVEGLVLGEDVRLVRLAEARLAQLSPEHARRWQVQAARRAPVPELETLLDANGSPDDAALSAAAARVSGDDVLTALRGGASPAQRDGAVLLASLVAGEDRGRFCEELRRLACAPGPAVERGDDLRLRATGALVALDDDEGLEQVLRAAVEAPLPETTDIDRRLAAAAAALPAAEELLLSIFRDRRRLPAVRYAGWRAAGSPSAWAEELSKEKGLPAQLRALLTEERLVREPDSLDDEELRALVHSGPGRVQARALVVLEARARADGLDEAPRRLAQLTDERIAAALRQAVDEGGAALAAATRWLAMLGRSEDMERVVDGAARAGGFVAAGEPGQDPLAVLVQTHGRPGAGRESLFEAALRAGFPREAERLGAAVLARWARLRLDAGEVEDARVGATEAAGRDPTNLEARRVLRALAGT